MPDDNRPLDYAPADPHSARRRRVLQIILISTCAAVLGVSVCGVITYAYAQRSMRRQYCASNLRMIGQAIQLYAQDCKGVYPPGFAEVSATQDVGTSTFVCPAAGRAAIGTQQRAATVYGASGTYDYVYTGAGLRPDTSPRCILAIEDPANHDMEGGHVLYAEGDVEWLSLPYLVQMLCDLQAGRNPPSSTTTLTTAQAAKLYDSQLKPVMPQLKSGTLHFPTTAPATRP